MRCARTIATMKARGEDCGTGSGARRFFGSIQYYYLI
jgi:hypothetical protein